MISDNNEITIPEGEFFALSHFAAVANSLEGLRAELCQKSATFFYRIDDDELFLSLEEVLDRINACLFQTAIESYSSENWHTWFQLVLPKKDEDDDE